MVVYRTRPLRTLPGSLGGGGFAGGGGRLAFHGIGDGWTAGLAKDVPW